MSAAAILVLVFLIAAAIITILSMMGKPGPLLHIAVLLICLILAITVVAGTAHL